MHRSDCDIALVAVSSWLSGWFWARAHLARKIRKAVSEVPGLRAHIDGLAAGESMDE